MLGNDDPPELAELLDSVPWGVHCEGRDVQSSAGQAKR